MGIGSDMVVHLNNGTPFSAESFILPDPDGQETLLIVLVAVFEAVSDGKLKLAEEQRPVRVADVYFGNPGFSSIRYEAELALIKPRVDVLLNGHAYAPNGVPARSVPVELVVGTMRKQLIVQGDRRSLTGLMTPTPQSFDTMPIIYERAYGGMMEKPEPCGDQRNLVGIGFNGAVSRSSEVCSDYPNVVYPGNENVPAGFGVVARGWKPRIDFAGTFDATWLAERAPLLPLDFDPRHYQCAPVDQQLPLIKGGEVVVVRNMTPQGIWAFQTPRMDVPVLLLYQERLTSAELRVDTVLIEPDDHRFTLTARMRIPLLRGPGALREVTLGHMKRTWLRAQETRKIYIDRLGDRGVDPMKPCFIL